MLERGFFNFLNFFSIFSGIFLPGLSMNGIRDWNFFPSFSSYLIPLWLKIMPGIGFVIFWIFLLYFSEFSCTGQEWTEFGTKILFSLSLPTSSRFGKKIMSERGFLIFWIFFLYFSEFSCPGRVWTEFGTQIFFPLFRRISSHFG